MDEGLSRFAGNGPRGGGDDMTKLILWKNQEMDKIRRDMDRLFERYWSNFGIDSMFSEWAVDPGIEMIDRGDTLEIKTYLPGFSVEDLDISVAGNRLAIRGDRRRGVNSEKGSPRYLRTRFGSFSRVLRLPCRVDADRTTAGFKDGVLTILLPKKEPGITGGVKVEVG